MSSIGSPSPEPDWRSLRAEFPIATRLTYLNTASASPLPRRAAEQGQRYYAEMLVEGETASPGWTWQRERVRDRIARLIGAAPGEITFTSGASHAFTLIAPLLGPASHVVAMADEFPRVTVPFRRHGDEIALVPSGRDGVIAIDAVARAIEPHTRAVITSAVMHGTGFRQDLTALGRVCRERGVPLVVDASQAIGLVSLDVQRDLVDVLAFAGYKGTMGGHGVGAIYFSRALMGSPTAAAWWRARDEAPRGEHIDADPSPAGMLDLGRPPFAAILALGGGLELLEEIGIGRIETRIHELTDYLHARLEARGFEVASPRARSQRAGITIVRTHGADTVVRALADARIIAAARGEGIRISLHIFNMEEDLDRVVEALASIRDGIPPARPETHDAPIACVDLNGVLDRYEGWKGAEHWDPPAAGAAGFLRALRARGYRIVVFTTRHYRGVWAWLRRHGLDELVSDVTDVKPAADIFVDDRAIPFRGDFDAALGEIDRFVVHWERR